MTYSIIEAKTIAYLLILVFFSIVFIQSGMDKIIDKKGNLSFLVSHLEKVFSRTLIKIAFYVVTFLEISSGILCLLGTFQLLFFEQKQLGLIGIFVGSVALLILLFGQRVSKNYDGAQTIAVYFILSIIGGLLS